MISIDMEVEFDTRFQHPFSMIIAGSSGSGKTYFTKLLMDRVSVTFEKIFWFYTEWQDAYRDCDHIDFIAGMPTSFDEYLDVTDGPKAMIFDDLMVKCASSELVAQAFTQKRHHQNVSVVLIMQNLYCQGSVMRNIHLNTEYIVLFRNPRNKSQFGHFARQIEPKKYINLLDSYIDATSRPFSHLLVDMKPHTPDSLRYRSDSLSPLEQIVYVI